VEDAHGKTLGQTARPLVTSPFQSSRSYVAAVTGWSSVSRQKSAVDLDALVRCRSADWPAVLERTWQRLVGRRLDAHGIPQTLDDQPAAAHLLRGGERERSWKSIGRHLQHHPRDARGWELSHICSH
jgi:hypothetical protein